jgi:GMP synthase-like glutamine amidotransferase
LPEAFEILESHTGQIDHVPRGWTRVVTKGEGTHTVNQCLRVSDAPIYSAQFHMESYSQTKDASKTIMINFLRQAKAWGGYNPRADRLPEPRPMSEK